MDNSLPIDIALQHYNEILKVKPKALQSKYPFSAMDEEDVTRTMKQIELVYQNLTPVVSAFVRKDNNSKSSKTDTWKKKKGGGGHPITIVCM
jgi:hypothetical protein